jgi:prepilin peptidase CpaA
MIVDGVLFLFLGFSFYSDLKYRKVFNFAVVSAILLGLGLNFAALGWYGLWHSLLGLAVGFALLFVVYLLGGMGAGDVKFLAAAGALKGANFVLHGTLFGVVIAGVVSIFVLLLKRRFIYTVKEVCYGVLCLLTFKTTDSIKFDKEKSIRLPYAAILAVGMAIRWFTAYCSPTFVSYLLSPACSFPGQILFRGL